MRPKPLLIMKAVVAQCKSLAVLLSVISMIILVEAPTSTAPQQKVCEKDTPAQGRVPDPDWPFAYLSWAEPYAADALQFFYIFENRASHSVPVAWNDAGILRVKTAPGERVAADLIDAVPSDLLDSKISVGPEGSGRRTYTRKNCLSGAGNNQRQASRKRHGTTYRFRGRVVGQTTAVVDTIDVEFSTVASGSGSPPLAGAKSVEYRVFNRRPEGLQVSWRIPGIAKEIGAVGKEELVTWGSLKFRMVESVDTRVTLVNQKSGDELVILRVPSLTGSK